MKERTGDIAFNKILTNIGIPTDANSRRIAYYTICIMIRIAIYSYILFNYKRKWIVYFALIVGLISAFNLYSNLDGNQWWSRKFQFIISILLIIISSFILITKNNSYNIIIPIILFTSLLGGISQDLILFM